MHIALVHEKRISKPIKCIHNSHKPSHAIYHYYYLWCHNFEHNASCCIQTHTFKRMCRALLLRIYTRYFHWIRNEIRCTFVSMKCLMHFSATLEKKHWIKIYWSERLLFLFLSVAALRLTLCVFSSLRWLTGWMNARHCRRFTMVAC